MFRQSELIARDSRRMKHIFVVKKGSFAIWKRLDPDGHVPKLKKHDFDRKKMKKVWVCGFCFKRNNQSIYFSD